MLGDGVLATVNVETVAEAHARTYEAMANNTAGGRYICYDRVIQRSEELDELEHQLGISSRTALVQSVVVGDRPERFELCKRKLGRMMRKLEGEPELTCTLAFREIQKIVKLYEKFGKKLGAYVYKFFTLVNFFRIK